MKADDPFLSQLDLIDGVVRFVCRRHRLAPADAEDFAGTVRLKLIESDCAVLRKFQHRSSLRTFLVAVVLRMYADYRNHTWGKWRPSAEAKRLGALAVQLERLVTRDGLTFDQAADTLLTSHPVGCTRADLGDIWRRLPNRVPRVFVSEEVLEAVPSPAPHGEDLIAHSERASEGRSVTAALDRALTRLDPYDRLLIKLRFYDGMSVADIARLQRTEQKPLYRRLEKALGTLRSKLGEDGLREEQITSALREGELL